MQATFAPTTRPAGRAAWIAVGSVLAVAAIVYGAFSVASLLAYDAYDRRATFTGAVRVVEVHASAGGVRITGSDRTGAEVDTHVIRGFVDARHAVTLVDGRLVVRNSCSFTASWCSVMSTIRVPNGVQVVIRASGGSARVTDVHGDLDIDSSGGGVHVRRAAGHLTLRSSGGGIDATGLTSQVVDASSSGGGVTLTFAEPPSSVRGRSSGGGVTVVVPHDSTSYQVDARSSGGGTTTDVRSDPNGRRHIDISSSGGGVTVRYPD
ncbi:MAG: hypothetical protein JWN67_3127 [Actinomycetia bacterium]|nr:hypothetical protein [Actinomycetes bacterium]